MNDLACRRVFLNDEYLPLADAKISVLDRGFLLGDSIYEVIPVFAGRPFRLPHHLQRLNNSLDAIKIENPHTETEWRAIISDLSSQYPDQDQSIYLQVTRGIAPVRDHIFPGQIKPSVFVMSTPLDPAKLPDPLQGIAAITLDDLRWKLCRIKATTLLANVLARQTAAEQGAAEAILIRNGLALEGAASNLFIVKNGLLITPPKGDELLPGITRDLVLELADKNSIRFEEKSIPVAELNSADEIWLSSSVREIIPVVKLDGVTRQAPGPLWRKMNQFYQEYKQNLRDGIISSD